MPGSPTGPQPGDHLVDARYWQKLRVERLAQLFGRRVTTVYRMLGRVRRQLR